MGVLSPSADFREELKKRGAGTAFKCYQCATCSSVCQLAPDDAPFPRKQMQLAQWGLEDQIAGDPAVWLCHQCNDCTVRCPRDAKPGDVMQVVRSLAVEKLATPRFMGKLVGKAAVTWPILLGIPLVYWVVVLYAVHGLKIPAAPLAYHDFIPHWLIYVTFFSLTGLVGLLTLVSAFKFWKKLGQNQKRNPGKFIGAGVSAAIEIMVHNRFAKCDAAKPRRWGHFFMFWGFILAALASALIIPAMYIYHVKLPMPLSHPLKWGGNIAGLFLVIGGIMLAMNRWGSDPNRAGASSAFDNFFLLIVLLVIVTGVLTEAARLYFPPASACWIYVAHLASVFCLFGTIPYSKFAHFIYRTLAMVHEKMVVKSK